MKANIDAVKLVRKIRDKLAKETQNKNHKEIIEYFKLDIDYFGEGSELIKLDNGTVYIIYMTWKNGVMFVFDEYLNFLFEISNPSQIKEGWGMTKY